MEEIINDATLENEKEQSEEQELNEENKNEVLPEEDEAKS